MSQIRLKYAGLRQINAFQVIAAANPLLVDLRNGFAQKIVEVVVTADLLILRVRTLTPPKYAGLQNQHAFQVGAGANPADGYVPETAGVDSIANPSLP